MDQILPTGRNITLIHFVFPVSDQSPTEWRIACMPKMTEFHLTPFHPNYQRTDDPRAVTCPACKKTDMYEKARKANA